MNEIKVTQSNISQYFTQNDIDFFADEMRDSILAHIHILPPNGEDNITFQRTVKSLNEVKFIWINFRYELTANALNPILIYPNIISIFDEMPPNLQEAVKIFKDMKKE